MSKEEFQRLILGPRYAVTLRDLEEHHLIRIMCFRCQHSSILSPSELLRWAPYTRLMDLEGKMVCRQCGNRSENKWEVVRRSGKEEEATHRSSPPLIGREEKPPVGGRIEPLL